MVLPASTANTSTQTAIATNNAAIVQEEVGVAEGLIQRAISFGKTEVLFNAIKIGNPTTDINDNSTLTANQISFRDAFTAAGYQVSIDSRTGYWNLSWGTTGVESSVVVYIVRTQVTPGAIETATNTKITDTLSALSPIAYPVSSLVQINGGNINESDIGLTDQVYYEYIVRVRQQDTGTDYSSNIQTALETSGLGYTSTNTKTYKVV